MGTNFGVTGPIFSIIYKFTHFAAEYDQIVT